MMTPAAAQLLAGITSGTLRSSFAPKVNSALLLAPDGSLAAPVRVSLPTESVKFERDSKQDQYRTGITLVLIGRGRDRSIVGVHQRFLSLDLDKKQWEEFRKKDTLDIQARLSLSKLEPLSVQALLQFSNGTVAMGTQPIELAAASGPGPHLTSLLLSNRIEPASEPADPGDPLRGPNYQLYLPAEPRFARADKLTAMVGLLDIPLHPLTRRPDLRLTFQIKSRGVNVASLPPEEIHTLRNRPKNDLIVLKQFDLQGLRPGKYTLEVTAEDRIRQRASSQTTDFDVE
jgi:hypothetical protein